MFSARRKRGQGSTEFVLISSIMFLIFIGMFIVIQGRISSAQKTQLFNSLDEMGRVINTEIRMADSVKGFYARKFFLPDTLGGYNYSLVLKNKSEIAIKAGDTDYVLFLDDNVSGNITKGWNVIRKWEDNITINVDPPVCSAACTPRCGQPDGCGDTCPDTDNNTGYVNNCDRTDICYDNLGAGYGVSNRNTGSYNACPLLIAGACGAENGMCDDTIDNDCDGPLNCSDSDCTGDPACPCAPTEYFAYFKSYYTTAPVCNDVTDERCVFGGEDTSDTQCCTGIEDCVYSSTCYVNGSYQDLDGDSRIDAFCMTSNSWRQHWRDCDSTAGLGWGCDGACNAVSALSGESAPFGEYEIGTGLECCGDDPGEYYIVTGLNSACCNESSVTGRCVNSTDQCTSYGCP